MTDDAVQVSRALGKRADMVVHSTKPYNAEPPRAALAAAPLTPLDAFYVRNHGPVPTAQTATYRLRIDGLVTRPQELSVAVCANDSRSGGWWPRCSARATAGRGCRRWRRSRRGTVGPGGDGDGRVGRRRAR